MFIIFEIYRRSREARLRFVFLGPFGETVLKSSVSHGPGEGRCL